MDLLSTALSPIVTIEVARHREKNLSLSLRRQALKLSFLNEISRHLSELAQPEELTERLLDLLTGVIDVRSAFVLLANSDGHLRLEGEFGLKVPEKELVQSNPVKDVIRKGQFRHLHNRRSIFSKYGHPETILLPIQGYGRFMGILGVSDRESRHGLIPFDEDDESILEAVAAQMSISLHNIEVYNELLDEKVYVDSVLQSIPAAVITTDSKGKILTYNSHAGKMLCMSSEHVNRPWTQIIQGRIAAPGEYVRDERLTSPAGEVYADVNVSPFYSHGAQEVGSIVTIKELTEEHRIRDMFGKYVSESVVDVLLKDIEALKLGGEERVVTVLFGDLRGFTSMSDTLDPQDIVKTLNVFFDAMVNVILKHNGTIDKLVGDEIMAVFGVPVLNEDDADRAIVCAQEMIQAMKSVNEQVNQKGLPDLHLGIGINTGPVVSGNIGSSHHMDYTVIGDTVNLASRLCDKAGPDELLVSQTTLFAKTNDLQVEPLSLQVKGIHRPLSVYRVVMGKS